MPFEKDLLFFRKRSFKLCFFYNFLYTSYSIKVDSVGYIMCVMGAYISYSIKVDSLGYIMCLMGALPIIVDLNKILNFLKKSSSFSEYHFKNSGICRDNRRSNVIQELLDLYGSSVI